MHSQQPYLFTADSPSADWQAVIPSRGDDPVSGEIEQIHFFDAKTAIAVGSMTTQIAAGHDPRFTSWILRTSDGGRNWDSIPVEYDYGVHAAMVFPDGHAWIGGSNGRFSSSTDYGRTWRNVTPPFDEEFATHGITMHSPTFGFAVGFGNGLRRTVDGGTSWTVVDTPLDQKLLPPDNEYNENDRMKNMALVGNHLVLHQGGRSFVTDMIAIHWKPTPVPLSLFVDGTYRTSLVGVDTNGYVVSIDSMLQVKRLAPKPLATKAAHVAVAGDRVYVLDEHDALYTIDHGRIDYRYPMSSTGPRPEFYHVTKRGDIWWGATSHHLYRSHTDTAGWYRVGSLPMMIWGMEARNGNEVILFDHHGQNYEFRFDERKFYTIPGTESMDFIGILRRGSRWVAYGGGHERRWEKSDRAMHGMSAPWSRPNGFVLVSNDSGRSWRLADEWIGEGISTAYYSTNGYLHLVSFSSRFRSIKIDESETIVTIDAAQTGAPTDNKGQALYFRGQRGWLRSHQHHAYPDFRSTSDGGNSWVAEDSAEFIVDIAPFRDGFLAMYNGDITYFDADSIHILASPVRPNDRTSMSVHPIDDNHILLEMAIYDSRYNSSTVTWKEFPVP